MLTCKKGPNWQNLICFGEERAYATRIYIFAYINNGTHRHKGEYISICIVLLERTFIDPDQAPLARYHVVIIED